jgi:hypothetical protein
MVRSVVRSMLVVAAALLLAAAAPAQESEDGRSRETVDENQEVLDRWEREDREEELLERIEELESELLDREWEAPAGGDAEVIPETLRELVPGADEP